MVCAIPSPACASIDVSATPCTFPPCQGPPVDASDLVHAPVLFAADAETGLPCVVVNVHEGTLGHLCGLHHTLTPLRKRLLEARLITASGSPVAPKGTPLNLRV